MGVSWMNLLQYLIVIPLVILAVLYVARHVLRQFFRSDQDFSEGGGACSNCAANPMSRKRKSSRPSHGHSS